MKINQLVKFALNWTLNCVKGQNKESECQKNLLDKIKTEKCCKVAIHQISHGGSIQNHTPLNSYKPETSV